MEGQHGNGAFKQFYNGMLPERSMMPNNGMAQEAGAAAYQGGPSHSPEAGYGNGITNEMINNN